MKAIWSKSWLCGRGSMPGSQWLRTSITSSVPKARRRLEDPRPERVQAGGVVEAEQPDPPERERVAVRRRLARAEPCGELAQRQLGLLGREEAEDPHGPLDRLVDRRLAPEELTHSSSSERSSTSTTVSACSSSITSGGESMIFWPEARATTPRSSARRATGTASRLGSSSTPSIRPSPR